ncbi:MAG TPA: dTMP kinase [Gammaproteobacteria bacterium]|nr:dTMP kinase [Gammaproteobacteria bacterium]
MTKGKFITIEGIEGAGKSTVIQFIKNYFEQFKINVVWTREPGGTELAEQIRHLLLHPVSHDIMEAETELLLMFAARAQHVKKCIIPALTSGKWVVSDRFVDASYAYQGGGRNIDSRYISLLDQWIVGDTYPDLTVLLDIDAEEGFKRTVKRGTEKDRIEQEKIDFFIRVRHAYLVRAKQYPERIKLIDASASFSRVENQIRAILDNFVRIK